MKRSLILLVAFLLLAGCVWTRQNESCLFKCEAGKVTKLPETTLVPVPVPVPPERYERHE